MKKTLAYLALLLTISSLALTLAPTVHSQTDGAQVVNYSYHFNSQGMLVVAGEIQNTGQNILQSVIVSGTATDAYGDEMLSGDVVWASNILPGQKAPFFFQVRSNLTQDGSWIGGISSVNVKVIQAPTGTQYQYQGVTITDNKVSTGASGEYTVSGNLKNTGDQSASNVAVVGTFYDSSGLPISVGYSSKITNMAPNGTNTFSLTALDSNQTLVGGRQISSYALMVQMDGPLISGTPPAPTVVTGPGSDSSGTTNNNNNNLSPIYIVAFAVAIAVVVAVLVLLTRRKPVEIATSKPSKSKKRKRR
jgi:preprotein translocase subunit SecG